MFWLIGDAAGFDSAGFGVESLQGRTSGLVFKQNGENNKNKRIQGLGLEA